MNIKELIKGWDSKTLLENLLNSIKVLYITPPHCFEELEYKVNVLKSEMRRRLEIIQGIEPLDEDNP